MPVEVGIWRLDERVKRVEFSPMPSEERLEDVLADDISILEPNLLLIGRQVRTAFDKYIDLVAIDGDGNLVVIELKKDKTPRDIVAQALDYGSWIRDLGDEDIAAIFSDFVEKHYPEDSSPSLDQVFCERFEVGEMPETLNENHELLIVAGELDDSTERIVNYLSDEYGVAINVVFFRFFRDEGNEYLSRVWLIDPGEMEAKVAEQGKEPWNGEFYVSFGHSETRHWDDARKYGFISGGGGKWYSRTLDTLDAGDRVWVNVPGEGYVGVGRVTQESVPVTDFMVEEDGQRIPITEADVSAPRMHDPDRPEDEWEYLVGVDWIDTVPLEEAIHEKGFFGNQNTVAKPRAKKWRHTVERLKKRFDITEAD